jgi:CPA2 family monovalent cation:H+ antiporter-2
MAKTARTLNPTIEIAVRSHNSQEAALLRAEGTGRIFVGENELALAMTRFVQDTVTQATT